MKTNALILIEECGMFQRGDRVLVGLSGGADSVALLCFLKEYSEKVPIEIFACHINHGIRGEEAKRDEDFCVSLCERLSVKLFTEHLSVPKTASEKGISEETEGRNERYRIFSELTERLGAKIAVAHNADDLAETVVFNMVRGTGAEGLCSLWPVRGNIVRPLLSSERNQIEEYLSSIGQDYVTDSTNLQDEYTRNRIRHRVMPVLNELNPQYREHISAMSFSLREDTEYLEKAASEAFSSVCKDGMLLNGTADLPAAIRKRVIKRFLSENGTEISRNNIEALNSLLEKGGRVNLSGNVFYKADKDGIVKEDPRVCGDIERAPLTEGENDFPFAKITLNSVDLEDGKSYNTLHSGNKGVFAVDRTKIAGKIFVRSRREGDYIRLFRRGGKTLKKLFNEAKIPLGKRSLMPVFEDEKGIIGVAFFGADQRVCADEMTKDILIIKTDMK